MRRRRRAIAPDDTVVTVAVGAGWGPIITDTMVREIADGLSDILTRYFAERDIAGVNAILILGQTAQPRG